MICSAKASITRGCLGVGACKINNHADNGSLGRSLIDTKGVSVLLVDVADWPADDFFATYPEGARDKRAYFPPDDCPLPFIKNTRRYLFKRSDRRYPEQFWGEIVAHGIGQMIDVPVPPAYPAIDSSRGEAAALIEWFYEDGSQASILGGRFMQRMIDGFDIKKGTQHNFKTITVLFRAFHKHGMLEDPAWLEYWAKGLMFDSLIGNTDRHQNNWAVLFRTTGGSGSVAIAPWFDNGTSFGCDRHQRKVENWPQRFFLKYLHDGKHHLRWDKTSEERCSLFDMPRLLVAFDPSLRGPMLRCVEKLNLDEVSELLAQCMAVPSYTRLSEWRARFMLGLLRQRKEILVELLS